MGKSIEELESDFDEAQRALSEEVARRFPVGSQVNWINGPRKVRCLVTEPPYGSLSLRLKVIKSGRHVYRHYASLEAAESQEAAAR